MEKYKVIKHKSAFVLKNISIWENPKESDIFVVIHVENCAIPDKHISLAMTNCLFIDLEYRGVLARFCGEILIFNQKEESSYLTMRVSPNGFNLAKIMIDKMVDCHIVFPCNLDEEK